MFREWRWLFDWLLVAITILVLLLLFQGAYRSASTPPLSTPPKSATH